MRLEKVDPAFDTVPLPPGATAGMAVGVEIPAPDLGRVVAVRIGAELMLGRPPTWASPAVDDHRGRATGRLRGRLVSLLTGGTVGLSGEARKRFGVAGGLAGWCGRLECSLIPCGAVVGPHPMQHEAKPQESQQQQLIKKQVRDHGKVPLTQL